MILKYKLKGEMKMIDMHIHTNNSDGTDSVKELLEKAENLKLKYISITDHDTCKSYDELRNIDYTNIFSGSIVKGIEMKVFYNGGTIEVLGYKINTEIMSQWLNDFYKEKSREVLQKKYFNLLYDKCKKMGLLLADKENINWNAHKDWASFVIYTEIKNHLENRKKEFFVDEKIWRKRKTYAIVKKEIPYFTIFKNLGQDIFLFQSSFPQVLLRARKEELPWHCFKKRERWERCSPCPFARFARLAMPRFRL